MTAPPIEAGFSTDLEQALRGFDRERLRREYWDQNEFLYIPQFLPRAVVEDYFVPQAQALKPKLNRNYIPGHKQGGSISYYQVIQEAPHFLDLYRSPHFAEFLMFVTNARLELCPDDDPHAVPSITTRSRAITLGSTTTRPITRERAIRF